MARVTGAVWGSGVLAIIGTVLLVAPAVSATTVAPFAATPSYATFGALSLASARNTYHSGVGSNTFVTPPNFSLASGQTRQSEYSNASSSPTNSSTYGARVQSGLYSLDFTCTKLAHCGIGNLTFTTRWSISWSVAMNSTCPSSKGVPTFLASTSLSLSVMLVNTSGLHPSLLTERSVTLYGRAMTQPGNVSAGKNRSTRQVVFREHLVAGDKYSLEAIIQGTTYAYASAGTTCHSYSSAATGITHPTTLDWIVVA